MAERLVHTCSTEGTGVLSLSRTAELVVYGGTGYHTRSEFMIFWGSGELMEFARMSLVRVAGLMSLSVIATTLQASVRALPAEAATPATRQNVPVPHHDPSERQATRPAEKRELVLVISPSMSAWNDADARALLDGAGPEPGLHEIAPGGLPFAYGQADIRQMVVTAGEFYPGAQTTRAWLAARYPHAPPQQV